MLIIYGMYGTCLVARIVRLIKEKGCLKSYMSRDYDTSNMANIFLDMSVCDAVQVLQNLGVTVKDVAGAFRCLSDILDDISRVWRKASDITTSRVIGDASQCLISSFKNSCFKDENDELDKFLDSFARSD